MVKPITFVKFCRDVLGLALTNGQRVFAAIAFDEVDPCDLTGNDREIARALFGDVATVPPDARTIVVATFGRASGKSTLAAARGLYRMLTADLSTCGPGSVPVAVVIAPSLPNAKVSIRMAAALVRSSPTLARTIESETADGFTLRRHDGRLVEFAAFAASRGGVTGRGRDILEIELDESEFLYGDGSYAITDGDIFSALSPRLLRGGKALFISTPWPAPTLTSRLFEENHGHPQTALAAHGPTLLLRDFELELAAQIDRERRINPSNTARERDCDRSVDVEADSALPRDWVVRAFRQPEGSAPDNRIGVLDSSAGSGDAWTWCILETGLTTPRELPRGERMVSPEGWEYWVVDVSSAVPHTPRPPPEPFVWLHSFGGVRGKFRESVSFDQVIEQVATHFEERGVTHVVGDQYQAYAISSALRRRQISYHSEAWTNQSKIDALALARQWFRDGTVYLSAGELTATVRDELVGLAVRPMPGGSVSIGARGRGHDDYAALILNAAIA